MVTAPIHSRQPRWYRNQTPRISNKKSSSVVNTGWTTLSSPKRRAVACSPNTTSIRAKPISQMPRLRAWAIRLQRMVVDSGAVSTPIRCSTEVSALTKAAVAART